MSRMHTKLKEHIEVKKGSYITKKDAIPGPYPVILGGREPAYYIDRFNHEGEAIVVSRSGASAGYVSFWNEPIFITDGFLIEGKPGIDYHFLYYLMKSKQNELNGLQRGAAIPHVTPTLINDVDVCVPSIEEQQRIASILRAYDNLIENNRRQIALLEEAAQRLYKKWFVDLCFPGHEGVEIVDGMPTNWTQVSLANCADIIRGRSYKSSEIDGDEGVALVNLKNLRSYGGWNDGAEKTYSGAFKDEQHVKAGDIIMGVTDMTKERRLVGHVALVPDLGREAIISMDLVRLAPHQMEPLYLYSVLRFSGIAENIALLANGTNVLHLKPQMLSSVSIAEPPADLQATYARYIEPMVGAINTLAQRIKALDEARNRLLPKLMSGEVEV